MNIKEEYGIDIPKSIEKIIFGLDYKLDNIGQSNSKVFIFDEYILKISKLSFDIENEIRVYNELKDKLPIPKIIAYEIINDTIYLLKAKIKGKLLSDDYYMKRPKLLFKLACEALNMLWSIDINNLDLLNTCDLVLNTGLDFYNKGLLNFNNVDKNVVNGFKSFEEIFNFLNNNKPKSYNVLCHGDLCLPNIICDNDKVVGFIDLGLMGISNIYHDIAILYRSIKYNFNGKYGKSYEGFDDNLLFKLLNIKKDNDLINYFLLLDEVLG